MNTFQDITHQIESTIILMQHNMSFVFMLIALLFVIHFINFVLGYRLNILGIYPRHIWGLIGLFFSPFLHGHFNHLFFNAIPLFILIHFVLLSGNITFYSVSATIIILGGLGTWLFGRKALHIGASGLIMGYWAYLLLNAYQQITVISIMLAIICLYYLGGLLFNLFPLEAKSSWEAHVFGFLAGLAANYTVPYLNPILASVIADYA